MDGAASTGTWSAELALAGAGGERVDLRRTFLSHGLADLAPMRVDEDTWTFEVTLRADGVGPRTVLVAERATDRALVTVAGPEPAAEEAEAVLDAVRHVLRLDEDLSPFYALAAGDPALSWSTEGAGRMIRSPAVFDDVVKTICTTNCAWSATQRMVSALVEHLGEPAPGAPATGPLRRAFPTPAAMAEAPDAFYRDVVRAGYRGRYLKELAATVAVGALDLEELARAQPDDLPDEEVYRRLLALPGVGPYAAAQIMMLLGRYSRLILDSWTRPKYARLTGRRTVKDTAIERRFRRYGRYAGLAFWLFLTRDWIEEPGAVAAQTR